MLDTATTSNIWEEKAVSKSNNIASEVENMHEMTKVAEYQNLTRASHFAIPVEAEPLCEENRYERLKSKENDKRCFASIDVVYSRAVTNSLSGVLRPFDGSGEASEKKIGDGEKAEKEEKADDETTLLFDHKDQRMAIPETRAASEQEEKNPESKESSQGGPKWLDVVLNETSEIAGVIDLAVGPQPYVTSEEHSSKNKESGEETEEAIAADETFLLLEGETQSTAIQDAPGPFEPIARDAIAQGKVEQREATINIPQTDQHGNAEQVVDFSAKELLSFAWQIAQGMVSLEMKNTSFGR